MSEEHGQERAERAGAVCDGLQRAVRTIVECKDNVAESRRAGGDAWYEVTVYVHNGGVEHQVQRHGSVIGGSDPATCPSYAGHSGRQCGIWSEKSSGRRLA